MLYRFVFLKSKSDSNIHISSLFYMNRHLLFAIIVLLTSVLAKSQTNVSGNIPGNTTWTKAGSPYILTGNVGVRTGYTLTIEPGVTVRRNGDFQILILGAVQINGTQKDSIEFVTDMNPIPDPKIFPFAPDTRYFIEFQKSDLNKSGLSYISFQRSNFKTNHIRMGNESQFSETNPKNTGALNISHSNLSNGYTTTNGYQTHAQMAIDSCIINNGFVYSYSSVEEDINITNSKIINSDVWNNSAYCEMSFSNCYLSNNNLYLLSYTKILNSTFENCNSGFNGGGNTIMIENSSFINTFFSNQYSNFDIIGSKFTINDNFTSPNGNEAQYFLSVSQISIRDTRFVNNSSYNISGINIRAASTSSFQYNSIIHNQFTNLYDAIIVNNFREIQVDSNYFSIPGRYDIVNYSSKDFAALYNYYQLKNDQPIDDVIFDQNEDLNYGLVTYTPYITDPIVLPVTSLHFSGTATEQLVKLSWQVSKETNVSKYVVERKGGNGFIPIGFATASGNNQDGVVGYSFTDSLAVSGTNYYRLKIVDADARYTYSNIVPVVFSGKRIKIALYPNPTSTYVIVEHKAVNTPAQLLLVDMQGRKLKGVVLAKGSTQTRVDLPALAKGIYKIVWQQDGKTTENQTLLIQ